MLADFQCRGPEATWAAGQRLGELLAAGDTLGLIGDLGAGKTLFVQGIAAGLGVPPEVRVTSPTFTLINDYAGGRLRLHHADLYRIERAAELTQLGFEDLVGGDGVLAVEWSERFSVLPADSLEIRIAIAADDLRTLTASGRGPRSRELVTAWAAALEAQGSCQPAG